MVRTIRRHHFLTSQTMQADTGPPPNRLSAPCIVSTSPSGPLSRIPHHPSTSPRLLPDPPLLARYPLDLPPLEPHLSDRLYDPSRSLVGQVLSDRPAPPSHHLIHGESVHSTRPSLQSGSTTSATPSSASGVSMSEAASTSSPTMYQEQHLPTKQSFPPLDRRPAHPPLPVYPLFRPLLNQFPTPMGLHA